MFSIYKFTLTKYLKSTSTWIIVAASMFIGGFIGGFLPFSIFDTGHKNAETIYIILSGIIIAGVTSILAIFSSIFAGFKAATMFKDEVEDGTFLVILSKPLKRSKIVFGKWLALQTMLIMYSFLSILTFCICITIFDVGNKIPNLDAYGVIQLRHKILYISAYMWGITALVGLIFSSIGILLSTKLSVGATIGISIGLGVVIPITSLFSTFTQKNEYMPITTARMFSIGDAFKATVRSTQFKQLGSEIPSDLYDDLDELEQKINSPNFISRMGIATGSSNAFKYMWPFDINFQINKLAEFASQQAIPTYATELAGEIAGDAMPSVGNKVVSTIDLTHPLSKVYANARKSDIARKNNYNVVISQLKGVMPLIHKIGGEVVGFAWDIIKKNLEVLHNNALASAPAQQVSKLGINFDNIIANLSKMPLLVNDSSQNLLQVDKIKELFKPVNIPSGSFDNITQDVINASQGHDPWPANAKEWEKPWYELSYELWTTQNQTIQLDTAFYCIDSIFNSKKYAADNRTFNSVIGAPDSKEQVSLMAAFGILSDQIPHALKDVKKLEASGLLGHDSDLAAMAAKADQMGQVLHTGSRSIYEMLNPLATFFFNKKNLDEQIKKHKINIAYEEVSINNILGIGEKDNAGRRLPLPDGMVNMGPYSGHEGVNLLPNDAEILQRVASIAYDKPDLLVKLSAQKYIKKLTLFWIYLGVALFLVPLSYFIVRRQDFR